MCVSIDIAGKRLLKRQLICWTSSTCICSELVLGPRECTYLSCMLISMLGQSQWVKLSIQFDFICIVILTIDIVTQQLYQKSRCRLGGKNSLRKHVKETLTEAYLLTVRWDYESILFYNCVIQSQTVISMLKGVQVYFLSTLWSL